MIERLARDLGMTDRQLLSMIRTAAGTGLFTSSWSRAFTERENPTTGVMEIHPLDWTAALISGPGPLVVSRAMGPGLVSFTLPKDGGTMGAITLADRSGDQHRIALEVDLVRKLVEGRSHG